MPPSNIRENRQQRKRRGRAYLLGTLALVLIIAVGWYVYATSQAARMTPTEIVHGKLNTSKGVIEVEVYQNAAPKTVANFVALARQGFYDELVWHRIVQGFVIQTSDPITGHGDGDRSA